MRCLFTSFLALGFACCPKISAQNQTPTVSKVHSEKSLPFRVTLKEAGFELPIGVQTYMHAVHKNKSLIITGRVDGLHGFVLNSDDNFPVKAQNTFVFVVDLEKKKTYYRSLNDPSSGLTQQQIDLLSVTAAQGYQLGETLFITGGYGVDTATGRLNTKDSLTAINVPGLIKWVVKKKGTVAENIHQVFDPIFKVTGGYMTRVENGPTLLIFGHDFDGFYKNFVQQPPVFQRYTLEVRRFDIHFDGKNLSFTPLPSTTLAQDPGACRRRDLSGCPIVEIKNKKVKLATDILSGVFTPSIEMPGVWTVPIRVSKKGNVSMDDPNLPSTFKQGMNNYDCATFGMFSEKTGDMYSMLFGGMSFGFFEKVGNKTQFMTDSFIPFISQSTCVKTDKKGKYSQFFLSSGSFPFIPLPTDPTKSFLLGSECEVSLLDQIPKYSNNVLKLDKIKQRTLVGYIIGGIEGTQPNFGVSYPSKRIFKIFVEPIEHKIR